jgi:hypothetical protein
MFWKHFLDWCTTCDSWLHDGVMLLSEEEDEEEQ